MGSKSFIKNLMLTFPVSVLVCGFQNCTAVGSNHPVVASFTAIKPAFSAERLPNLSLGTLTILGVSREERNPNLYLLKKQGIHGVSLSVPAETAVQGVPLILTKVQGNCRESTPQEQSLVVNWQKMESKTDGSGMKSYSATVPFLQDEKVWNEQLRGCDFELSVRINAKGQMNQIKVTLDAMLCSDGEHTQLSAFSDDCLTQRSARRYANEKGKVTSHKRSWTSL